MGVAVIYFSDWERDPVLLAIGLGIVAYALAVAFYTLLGAWRLHRLAPAQPTIGGPGPRRLCRGRDQSEPEAHPNLRA